MGMESVWSTCIPQTGSRTSRRAALEVCALPAEFVPACREAAFGSSEPKRRLRSRTLQESTSSQNKNRRMRARSVMGAKTDLLRWYPQSASEVSVCKAKSGSQTKRREFKRLRGGNPGDKCAREGLIACKSFITNSLNTGCGVQTECLTGSTARPRRRLKIHYLAAGMRSMAMYGRRTSGIKMEPSAC